MRLLTRALPSDVGKPTGGWAHIYDMPVPYYHPKVPYDMPNHDFRQAYGPLFTKWLAQSELVVDDSYAAVSAENYALFFMANYVNRQKGFYPSLPQVPINPLRAPIEPGDWIGTPDTRVAGGSCDPPEPEVPVKGQVNITGTSAA